MILFRFRQSGHIKRMGDIGTYYDSADSNPNIRLNPHTNKSRFFRFDEIINWRWERLINNSFYKMSARVFEFVVRRANDNALDGLRLFSTVRREILIQIPHNTQQHRIMIDIKNLFWANLLNIHVLSSLLSCAKSRRSWFWT